MPRKPYLTIYHGNCMDGFGAAFSVYSSSLGHQTDFVKGVFGEPPPDVTGRHVLVVDFSYSAKVMKEMAQKALSVTILDHHASAQKELQPLLDEGIILGLFDMNRSGAMITWEYCNPKIPAPDLIRYIEDRDLWRFELPHSKEIHAGISSYPLDFEVWDELMKKDINEFRLDGQVLLRKKERDLEQLLPMVTRSLLIAGYLVPAANVPHLLASDVGSLLAKDAPFAATYFDTETDRVFSLRSTDSGMDVSLIAKQYQGGGHKKAAGFRVPLRSVLELEPKICIACSGAHISKTDYCSAECENTGA